jgi:quercetin dioxygenase-like cupin family protein
MNFGKFWLAIPTLVVGDTTIEAHPGDEFFIERGSKHRISAGRDTVQILEISLGEFDEDDITRLEDRYGRAQAA